MGLESFNHLSLNDNKTLHPLFQDPTADVTFSSADGTHFLIHRKYLEINTSAFPGAEFDTMGEVTPLSENREVLELLFQFVYPRRHPDLDEMEVKFEVLSDLAEAAEKYEVFAAVGVCKMQMRKHVDTHPLAVLSYATRHDYPQLLQDVVPHLARRPCLEIAELLPPRLLLPWMKYRASWDALFDDQITFASKITICKTNPSSSHISFGMSMPSSEEPQACSSCIISIIRQLQDLRDLGTLKELNDGLDAKRKDMALRKGVMKLKSSSGRCNVTVCQYDFVLDKCIKVIEEGKGRIVFLTK